MTGFGDRMVTLTDRQPMAILEKSLRALHQMMLTTPTIDSKIFDVPQQEMPRIVEIINGVGIVKVRGTMFQFASFWDRYLGTTSYEEIGDAIDFCMFAPDVKSIVLSMDSPGGQAAGCETLAAEIRNATKTKSIISHVVSLAASAGYYLSSACNEIWIQPSAAVGSIGTVMVLYDDTEFMKKIGIEEIPVISSVSPNKWPDITTDEGLSYYQDWVDKLGEIFAKDVAKYRGVTYATVKRDFGKGWVKIGQEAVDAGMADRIGTFTDVVSQLSNGYRPRKQGASNEGKHMATRQERLKALKSSFNQLFEDEDEDPPTRTAPPAPAPAPVQSQTNPELKAALDRIQALETEKHARETREQVEAQTKRDAETKAENDRLSLAANEWADGEIKESRAFPADKPGLVTAFVVASRGDKSEPIENYSRLDTLKSMQSKVKPHSMTKTVVPSARIFTLPNDSTTDDKEAREERRKRTVQRCDRRNKQKQA